jgi:hypothetical protein
MVSLSCVKEGIVINIERLQSRKRDGVCCSTRMIRGLRHHESSITIELSDSMIYIHYSFIASSSKQCIILFV